MQYSQITPTIQRYFVAFVAVLISVVLVTNMPVRAVTLHQAAANTVEDLRKNINAALEKSITAIKQNEKDMATLGENLKGVQAKVAEALVHTRDEINKYIQGATVIKDKAEQLVKEAGAAIKTGVQQVGAAAEKELEKAVTQIQGFVATGTAIVDEAKQLVAEGQQKLEELRQSAEQFTKEQIALATEAITEQIAVANEIVKKVGEQVAIGVSFASDAAGKVGAAVGEQLQKATATVKGFVDAGVAAVTKAGEQVAAGVEMLQNKVKNDLQAMKDAIKVNANESGVSVEVNLGNGLVAYAGLNVPPEVAEGLKKASEKTAAALATIQEDLKALTDPEQIKTKVKLAVKQLNDAAITSVFARTTKAINSQVAVIDALQVSANALQVQVNKLQQCIRESSTSEECAKLQTAQNSADQGASLQESINGTKVNIQTVRSFLSASIDLTKLLKDENYRGTVQSLTAMTSMMSSVSTLSNGLRNDLNNLNNAVNI